MQHEQLSLFDLISAPMEGAAPAPVQVDAGPVPVMIQASAKVDGGYRVFGIVRIEIALHTWNPTAGDVLALFPLSLSYDMSRGLLDRSCVIDLFAHEIDGDGNRLHALADAHATVKAGELYDAAGSF